MIGDLSRATVVPVIYPSCLEKGGIIFSRDTITVRPDHGGPALRYPSRNHRLVMPSFSWILTSQR